MFEILFRELLEVAQLNPCIGGQQSALNDSGFSPRDNCFDIRGGWGAATFCNDVIGVATHMVSRPTGCASVNPKHGRMILHLSLWYFM